MGAEKTTTVKVVVFSGYTTKEGFENLFFSSTIIVQVVQLHEEFFTLTSKAYYLTARARVHWISFFFEEGDGKNPSIWKNDTKNKN